MFAVVPFQGSTRRVINPASLGFAVLRIHQFLSGLRILAHVRGFDVNTRSPRNLLLQSFPFLAEQSGSIVKAKYDTGVETDPGTNFHQLVTGGGKRRAPVKGGYENPNSGSAW